ncbi:M23 family metallopeptidase [Glaciecola petra]|uniref:M23 family metallopeptidase n=1 Tax=Glaciecola petra TaxID=3075602 RepID=A0ABU2ZLK7_9ALTE|nr:M23 family metallopeptidase [Aestuariibacter sp. P117]MDT0593506.1 M23 family metallopeptidase [Aestuariibacter sp. P117]
MSITVLIKGKNLRFAKKASIRKSISIMVGLSLVFLVSSRNTDSVLEDKIRINTAKTGLQEQAKKVDTLEQHTNEKLSGIIRQVASMQSQLNQLDSLSATLADKNGLTKQDFLLPEEINNQLQAENELDPYLQKLSAALDLKIQQVTALESIILGLNIEQETELAGRPIGKGWLSSHYGMRKDPFSGKSSMHKGVDFAGKVGSSVIATGAGIVTWSGERFGYGNLVEIDHGNGIKTRYGHNHALSVKIGDVVTKGQEIALMGSTGRSTGPHVHFEVLKNGRQVDPLPYIYN